MTLDEFLLEFENELFTEFNISKQLSPIKTGNLRNNAIKIMKSPRGYKIWVDLSIAPYAKLLDSKPKVQREHPDGWFNEIAMDIINKLLRKYGNQLE